MRTSLAFILGYCFLLAGCQQPSTESRGLNDYYRDYFTIGVAVSPQALHTDEAALIVREFGSLTPENAMKMGPIHPHEDEYDWTASDSIVAFAVRNNLRIRGHTLCWHNQTPSWMFTDAAGDTVTKEVLLKRLHDHIATVVGRYKGKIYAWDVVNEVISDNDDVYFRRSPWYTICGEDFVAKAFEYAHEADPDAMLFYNDYQEINPVKRGKIIRLIKSLQEKGVPIHGIGLQAHWALHEPDRAQLDATLTEFSALQLPLQITELDISVYPKEHRARERKHTDQDTVYTHARQEAQADMYAMCFELFRKHQDAITGVTFWNISDRSSWLDNFPVRGRKDYPLLFDQTLKPKKAYARVITF